MARGPQDPMHSLAEGKILQVPFFLVLDYGLRLWNWEEIEEFVCMVIDGLQQPWIWMKLERLERT